jgi:hypothetical protein
MQEVAQADVIVNFRNLINVGLVFERLRFFEIFYLFFEDGNLLLLARLVNNF